MNYQKKASRYETRRTSVGDESRVEIRPGLKEDLKYLDDGLPSGEKANQLDNAVRLVKSSEERRHEYMVMMIHKMEIGEEGIEEAEIRGAVKEKYAMDIQRIFRKCAIWFAFLAILSGGLWVSASKTEANIKSKEGEYFFDIPSLYWIGQDETWIRLLDDEGRSMFLDEMTQNNEIFSVTKEKYRDEAGLVHYEFYIKPVKTGKTTLTVYFIDENGTKVQASIDLTVKKYPKAIKSLKVNGKTENIAGKKRFACEEKCKKNIVTIQLIPNKNWKISKVSAVYSIVSGDAYKTRTIPTKTITKGKNISFAGKWDSLTVSIFLKNKKGSPLTYSVTIVRSI